MKKLSFLLISIALLGLQSCGSGSPDQLILGNWEASFVIPGQELARVMGEEMQPGMDMDLTGKSTGQFFDGGRYNNEGDLTLRIAMQGQEVALKFTGKESGTWVINDNNLIQVVEDAKVVPLDDQTRLFLDNAPEMRELLEPVKGETRASRILSLDENSMQLEPDDLKGIKISYSKKS